MAETRLNVTMADTGKCQYIKLKLGYVNKKRIMLTLTERFW